MDHALAALNAELARHAMPGGIDLELSCAEQRRCLRLRSVEGRLTVSAAVAGAVDTPTATIEFATADAARRLVVGGKSAAITLFGQRKIMLR